MKIKLQDCVNFDGFYQNIKDQKLNLKTAFKLSKIFEAVQADVQFYRESLTNIISTYAIKTENGEFQYNNDGTQIMIQPDFIVECNQKIIELNNLDYDIEIEKYLLSFEDLANVDLPVEQWSGIIQFIKE